MFFLCTFEWSTDNFHISVVSFQKKKEGDDRFWKQNYYLQL